MTVQLPLSPLQYGMVLHGISDPGVGVNVLQKIISIRHELDFSVFEQALRELVAARPTLRTMFLLDDPAGPSQVVLDHVEVVPHFHDLTHLDESAQVRVLRDYLDRDGVAPFDFTAGPPTRFAVFRFSATAHEFVWTLHHALHDGRSCAIVLAELFALYDAHRTGRPFELPQRPPFSAYLRWLSEQDVEAAAAFWRHTLADVPVPTPFGMDSPRELGPGETAFGMVEAHLGQDVTGRLDALAKDGGGTPNNVVQAAWAVLLHQVSGNTDVVFGATRACRSFAPDAQEMVGLFFNTVPFRVSVAGTVGELLTRLRVGQVALRAVEHSAQWQIRGWLGLRGGQALFNSIVVFENYQYDDYLRALDPAWHARSARFEERTGYQFTLSAFRGERLHLKLGYDRRRVAYDVARRVLDHLRALLAVMVLGPQTRVADLPAWRRPEPEPLVLPRSAATPPTGYDEVTVQIAGDLGRVLAFLARLGNGNGRDISLDGRVFRLPAGRDDAQTQACETEQPEALGVEAMPVVVERVMTLGGSPPPQVTLFVLIAPDACRLVVADDVLVHGKAAALGAALLDWPRDLPGGPPLAGHDAPRVHDAVARQAALRPDAPAVVFEGDTLTYRELAEKVERVAAFLQGKGIGPGALVGVCLERSVDLVPALLGVLRSGAAFVPLDPIYPPDRIAYMIEASGLALVLNRIDDFPPGSAIDPPVSPDDLAYVIYTSGSTGRPKGVRVTHRGLANLLSAMAVTPGCDAGDRLLAVTTVCFDIAYLELFLPLTVGGMVEILPARVAGDGFALRQRIENSAPTVMQATPATWQMLITAGWTGKGVLRALCGGEALSPELAQELTARCGEVWNMYGPTETTIWSAVAPVRSGMPVTIGEPIDNTQFLVLDRWGQPVLPGMPGELHIGGAGVALGYLGNPELTDARFWRGGTLYRTGDLVRQRPDGAFEYLDRLDNQVKVHGYRVEPGEIEAVLREHDTVGQAVVIAREDTPGNRRLVGYLLPADSTASPRAAQLRDYLSTRLPQYMVPAAFVVLRDFPRTLNGKVDRAALPAPTGHGPDGGTVAPRSRLEKVIAGIWRDVLGVERVGIDDSFFDLGGNSMLLTRVLARLRADVAEGLSTVDMFAYPTVRTLAAHLSGSTPDRDEPGPGYDRMRGRAAIGEMRRRRQVLDQRRGER